MRINVKRYLTLNNTLAAISGILFAITFFSKWFGFFGWICFVPLFYVLKDKDPRESFNLGMITGAFTNFISLYWLVGTLTRFGGFPLPVSVIFIGLFCLYSALQFGIFTYLISKLKLNIEARLKDAVLICAIWTVAEYFFPVLFPFGIGNSQAFYIPLIQIVDLLGVKLLSFLIIFVNISIVYLIWFIKDKKRFPAPELMFSAMIFILLFAYGYMKIDENEKVISESKKIKVGIVQANFDYFEKNTENEFFITETHQKMSTEINDADLIVWPETAVQHWFPLYLNNYKVQDERKVTPSIKDTFFLIGGLSFIPYEVFNGDTFETEYTKFNTAFLTNSESLILGTYNKVKLLMFGEYFPLINTKLKFIKNVIPVMGDLTPGKNLNILEVKEKDIRIGALICYEDILPYFGREFTKKGANVLINMTNDAWFGESYAPFQHLLVSIPRAVENRRYLIRSTNSGVSAIISPTGKIESRSGIFTRENLEGKVALIESRPTLYAKVGDIFPWICLIGFVLYFFGVYLVRKYGGKST